MPEARFPIDVIKGVPVVAAPEEIDITNAAGLRAALLEATADGRNRRQADGAAEHEQQTWIGGASGRAAVRLDQYGSTRR